MKGPCRRLRVAALSLSLLTALATLASATPAAAQCVSLTTLGSAYTQNFDTLSNTAGSTTNNLTITGWFMTESGGGARDNELYAVDTGGSNTGDTYSYGAAGSTERALGALRSGTLIPIFGACFTNNTGSTLTSLDVAYVGEEWRLGTAGRTDQLNFEYSTNATDLVTGTWTGVAALNFVTPDTATTGAKNGNAAADRTAISSTIASLSIANGATFWIRWTDTDASGADDGLAVDDFSLTPNGTAGPVTPNLSIGDVSQAEGNAGTTTFTFTVSLSSPALAGGVTFDIATADGTATTADGDYVSKSLTLQTIAAGSSSATFDVTVNGDTKPEANETFTVNVTNVVGANVTDGQAIGTILNDDAVKIHDVQGNGPASPMVGSAVIVEGVVTASFQGTSRLQGFFLQEEDADADADPATSEGIFVYCNTCPTAVAEGQRVMATGTVSETNGMTQINATTAGSVTVTDAGNHLAEVTPTPIALPVVGDVDAFYEAREGMLVTFADTLTVSEHFELARFGQIVLAAGSRPFQFTETALPSVSGYSTHLDSLARRQVILDDDNNGQEAYLSSPSGQQAVFHPRANGGFSIGTQGVDFFRAGDLVPGLTGVLHWSWPGYGANTWRVRPTAAHPVSFTAANPRPASAPAVGGGIRAVSMNTLNYFTTIDTTASSSSGPCGPGGTLDCRGADSVAELNRQRERLSVVVCGLNPDVAALLEVENTTPSDTIVDLLGAVNARCGGAHPYSFANTGGTLGTDAIRSFLIYRTGVLSPVGSPLVDLDPIHERPPTAQTFDVVDPLNRAFGERFTVAAVHLRSKGCSGATGSDADALDGQSCYNARRTSQVARILTWIAGTVVPAAGDPDLLLVGDFNAYGKEDPVRAVVAGGYVDVTAALAGPSPYSFLFDGQLGRIDFAFASASLAAKATGAGPWHVNADEVDLFDYNDEVADTGEASYEAKPSGSALVPPRTVYQAGTPYRAADHDPLLVGLFASADLSVTVSDSPDPVNPGGSITYTITAANAGPDAAASATLSDTLPAGTSFVSLTSPAGWSCTTPAVGAGGTISCSAASMAAGNAAFTLAVSVSPSAQGGTSITDTASVASSTSDPNGNNGSGTATTAVAAPATVRATKTVSGQFYAGGSVTYTIVLSNSSAFPQPDNPGDEFTDLLPAGLHLVSASATSGTATADVPSGTVRWNGAIPALGSVTVTIAATVSTSTAPGTSFQNQGTVSFDATGNGTNGSTAFTDDPSLPGAADATAFVAAAAPASAIPALDPLGLAALAAALAAAGLFALRGRWA